MTTARQLLGLLRSHMEGDNEQFYAVALQLAAHEAKQGHVHLAQELKELIDTGRSRQQTAFEKNKVAVPLAQPKGDLASLVAVRYSDVRLSSMILPDSLEKRLKRGTASLSMD
jgi:hypothetical protein